ncbi:uncharacterized protein K444DRAFT_689202 [Hyaloscypha bicolor E]|uniref:SET domain-containing protein n=1 Tax=Hyaloscypha bicolor E TaxID=1095630 RepID=A0A2J6TV81_9HELO|nr:uncharacterized protein K444DRAFT_689202 [Hyaloscypha bicolor E]PMD66901.1 hypothetical protein K444DRAFT_689202 [Hyaloscypha bicolor E]
MSSSASEPIYALQEVLGKGKGLVAIRKIHRGIRILSEEPIVRVPEAVLDSQTLPVSIRRQVDALTADQRQAFLSMYNIYADDPGSRYLGIIRTNALPFGDNVREGGIFLNTCRINYTCDNNAQKSWNDSIKRYTVHALRDIEKGEEITIYYLGVLNSRKDRQEALRRKFAFTCSYRLCSLPPDQSQESNRRLDEILKLDSLIGGDGLMGILAFLDAAQIAIANGDLARVRIFVKRAVLGWIILEGDDSPNVLQYKALTQDPSKYELYGILIKWKTAVDDIPQGLDPKELDDWLWRREKPKRPGQPADFRNRATFPGFDDLPDENDVSPEFYTSSDGFTYRPRRHWLFLAEIVDFRTLVRLQMDIKDIDGRTIPLSFRTVSGQCELKV